MGNLVPSQAVRSLCRCQFRLIGTAHPSCLLRPALPAGELACCAADRPWGWAAAGGKAPLLGRRHPASHLVTFLPSRRAPCAIRVPLVIQSHHLPSQCFSFKDPDEASVVRQRQSPQSSDGPWRGTWLRPSLQGLERVLDGLRSVPSGGGEAPGDPEMSERRRAVLPLRSAPGVGGGSPVAWHTHSSGSLLVWPFSKKCPIMGRVL